MQEAIVNPAAGTTPLWFGAVSMLGVLWNAYGVYQFAGTFTPAGQAAMTAGMTPAQAELYLSLPSWITVAFAVGVFGGLIGSVLLATRRRVARTVLTASLLGYCLLFSGDTYYGVFAAIPSQLVILAVVVLISAALSWLSWLSARQGALR